MAVVFHKMHGAGNDFVLLDLREQHFELDPARARKISDRHTGIGCDQLLVLRSSDHEACAVQFEVWNADGSKARQCGNGVRCIALYLDRNAPTRGAPLLLDGPAGVTRVEWIEPGVFRADMGQPEWALSAIPLSLRPDQGWYRLETAAGPVRAGAVSMGNPHAVIPVDDLSAARLNDLGTLISRHAAFPEGCNAGFAQVLDRKTVRLRVFERGTGETRSCGSGACAAAAVLSRAGLTESTVEIIQEGGTLKVERDGAEKRLLMTGPAAYVFQGIVS